MNGIDTRTADEIEMGIRWEVREEIAEAMFRGHQSGEFDCGGQRYCWFVAD